MTDDTDTTVDIDNDLEAFENDFFQREEPAGETNESVEEAEEEVDENESNQLATDEDEEAPEDEESDEEDDEEEDEEPEEEPKPKRNRKSAKERIEELVKEKRETERAAQQREAELLRRLEALEALNKEVTEPADIREQLPADAPNPDAVKADGEPVYPLGEFDPQYIRDLTKFTIEQETKAAKEREAQERQAEAMEQARQEIADAWMEKVEEVEKEIPELRENMKTLTETFANLDPTYGEYLASTIMISEVGPQIMNYLSQNIGEAQKIVASGPAAATLALGRLEARLLTQTSTSPEEKRNTKKVSEAPEPPEERARGRGGRFAVAPDTDDLNAFERVFFK